MELLATIFNALAQDIKINYFKNYLIPPSVVHFYNTPFNINIITIMDAKLPVHLPYNITDRELCLAFRCRFETQTRGIVR